MIVWRLFRLLLPALIPSWRFFRTVAPSPRIELRGQGGPWAEAMPRPAKLGAGRMLRRLFWNPRWNEALYLVSLSERVVERGSVHAMRELEQRAVRLRPDARLELRLVFVDRGPDGVIRLEVLYHSAPFGKAR